MSSRIESDSLGEISLPETALYGPATARAKLNFQISSRRFGRPFIRALGLVKWAAAKANGDLNLLPKKTADVIAAKAMDVAEGRHDEAFILDVFQTGSGTSTHMNANEVIANLANAELGESFGANRPVHPNDHVNRGQSSNDVIPSAIHVAAALLTTETLFPALKLLGTSLKRRADDFASIVKIGRTHLQDATPVTLGQEFSGYAQQLTMARLRIEMAFGGLTELALGGTAVGTGINAHPDFAKKACTALAAKTGIRFVEAQNHFEAQGARDACVFFSGALKSLAVALMKIAVDLRLMASGPRCGLGEISLPELQAGSSIMPGKSNPVVCEAVMQAAAQVQGNDVTIQIAGQFGNFELNAMMPVLAANLLESIEILSNAITAMAEKCVDLLAPDINRCRDFVEQSLSLITKLTPVIGYDEAARIAKKALKEGQTIREALRQEQRFSDEDIDALLDPLAMLSPRDGAATK